MRSNLLELVKKELNEAFFRSAYYFHIMKAVATLGRARWKNVVNYLTSSPLLKGEGSPHRFGDTSLI
jgi:hypothetical protein